MDSALKTSSAQVRFSVCCALWNVHKLWGNMHALPLGHKQMGWDVCRHSLTRCWMDNTLWPCLPESKHGLFLRLDTWPWMQDLEMLGPSSPALEKQTRPLPSKISQPAFRCMVLSPCLLHRKPSLCWMRKCISKLLSLSKQQGPAYLPSFAEGMKSAMC